MKKKKTKSKLFDPMYTGRFKQTKAITLEMVPYGNTVETIKKNNWLESDAQILESIKGTMPYFDDYICACTSAAMDKFTWDWERYALNEAKEKDALKKAVEAAVLEEMGLSKTAQFTGKDFIFGDSHKGTDGNIITFLKKNGRYDDVENLRQYEGFLPIYEKLLVNKKTAIETWIPERIVENFDIYNSNLKAINEFLDSEFSADFYKNFEDECDMFRVIYGYSGCMSADGISAYNRMLRGISDENSIVTKGMINWIEETNNLIKTKKLKTGFFEKPKKLYKQVLAPADKQFTIEQINDDEDLRILLKHCMEQSVSAAEDISDYFLNVDKEELGGILYDGRNAHALCHMITKDHGLLTPLFITRAQNEIEVSYAGKKLTVAMEKAKEKKLQEAAYKVNKNVYSLADAIVELKNIGYGDDAEKIIVSKAKILCDSICMAAEALTVNVIVPMAKIKGNDISVGYVRTFFDKCTELRQFLKMFVPVNKTDRISPESDKVAELHDELRLASTKANNKARNYLTKKTAVAAPKQQIFFGNSAKLNCKYWNGMDPFGNENNGIVKMDDMYYLFTLTRDAGRVRFDVPVDIEETVGFLTVNRMQDPKRNIPAWVWTKAIKSFFDNNPTENVYPIKAAKNKSFIYDLTIPRKAYEIYRDGLFMTNRKEELGEEQWKENLTELIKIYIKFMKAHKTCSHLRLDKLKKPEEYINFGDFCNHVASFSTSMEWTAVSKEQILELVENGKALMFLVKNQNMYRDIAHGYDYDHPKTSYAELFLASLSDENFADMNLRLSSRPTFWFRPASVPYRIAHKKGEKMLNKNTLDGRYIPDTGVRTELKEFIAGRIDKDDLSNEAYDLAFVYRDGKEKNNLSWNVAKKDIVWKESLTRDMYLVTFTVENNAGISYDSSTGLAEDARLFEQENGNIISVTRNRHDLLYYTLTDRNGAILNEGSLNVIDNVDYKTKLMLKTDEKNRSREEWTNITSADEIKSTYMRKAVHVLKKMAVENNARIVVEYVGANKRNNNAMFDDQVYGKFVDLLKNGMSAYSDPEITRTEGAHAPGGRLNPLQLSFDSKGWNAGFVQEESGAYSSGMCPKTGFVNAFVFGNINTVHEKKEFFKRFKDITFHADGGNKWFEFSFDYSDFVKETSLIPPVTFWTVKAAGERFVKLPDHKYNIRKNIAEYLCEVLAVDETSGTLVDMIDEFTGTQVTELFNVFKTVVFGYHTRKTADTEYYYIIKDEAGNSRYSTKSFKTENEAIDAAIEAGLGLTETDVNDLIVESGGEPLYISPVTGEEYNYSRHASLMLAEKHRYFMATELGNKSDANIKWLERKQNIA